MGHDLAYGYYEWGNILEGQAACNVHGQMAAVYDF